MGIFEFEGLVALKPRERMMEGGERSLSNEELIAILLRTGGDGKDVLELSREIVQKFPTLRELSNAAIEELMSIKGVGVAKATSLKAALELGKRLHEELVKPKRRLKKPEDVLTICEDLKFESKEILRIIGVDGSLGYISHKDFTSSLSSAVELSKRDIFKFLIRIDAVGFFMVHNHSSSPKPSDEDIRLTRSLKKAGEVLDIKLVDHVIIGPKGFTSFLKEGLI